MTNAKRQRRGEVLVGLIKFAPIIFAENQALRDCTMAKFWEFWIDVGGTFTDCIAQAPDDRLLTCKTLSSGVTKGRVEFVTPHGFTDSTSQNAPPSFWKGFECRVLNAAGEVVYRAEVTEFAALRGGFDLGAVPEIVKAGMTYELQSSLEAPVLAMRWILGLTLDEPLPPVLVKLGTTRGTNALLERRAQERRSSPRGVFEMCFSSAIKIARDCSTWRSKNHRPCLSKSWKSQNA